MSPLEIRTLGGLTVCRNGTPIANFDQRKVPALLVYLACTERPQPREMLAELFWEDRSQSQSLANLRVALSNLRKTVGPFVDITRETASMAGDSGWWLDVTAFEERLMSAGDDPARLEEALELYRGDFLEGFYIDSQGFEDWARLERERLRFQAMEALGRLIGSDLVQRNYAEGVTHASRLLQLDPLREKTHRHLMYLLALSGEREAALAQYETCRQMLETEFGVQPMEETVSLFDRIQAGQLRPEPRERVPHIEPQASPKPSWQLPRHNLPAQPTSFVGREWEMEAITEQLAIPDCRLLTLVGPGGIGKTRLALAAAERLLDTFAHGVFFVSLTALTTADSIAPTIAGEMGLQISGSQQDADQELMNFLREKQFLLVLDNFEHLLSGADLVSRMLSTAPAVKVLTTSREPLNIVWECLFEVRGLLYPTGAQTGQADNFGALQLFVERARRARPDFHLAPVRDSVIQICQMIDGMPLGIEIAAAWVRVLPVDRIAEELFALDLPQRDVPERHRSLRALLDYTWQQLTPAKQQVFKSLSVFRGGFTAEAAEAVAGASVMQLVGLVNKSLLQWDSEHRRYHLHELLRQYGEGLLASVPDDEIAARQRHSEYYCAFLEYQLDNIRKGMHDAVLEDFDNALAAWEWAVSNANLALISQSMHSLFGFFIKLYWGGMKEPFWRQVFRHRGHALAQRLPTTPERDAIVGHLLAMECPMTLESDRARGRALAEESLVYVNASGDQRAQAFVSLWTGWHQEGEVEFHLRRSVDLYTAIQDGWGMAISSIILGLALHFRLLRPAEALVEVHKGLELFRQLQNPRGTLDALMALAMILSSQGEYDRARPYFQEALELSEQFGPASFRVKAMVLNNMAGDSAVTGVNLDEAEQQARQALAISRDYVTPHDVWTLVDTLALVKYGQADYEAAFALANDCLDILNSMPDPHPDALILTYARLGLFSQALGRVPDAYRYLAQSLNYAIAYQLSDEVLDPLFVVALTFARDGRTARALDLLGFTLPRPAKEKPKRDEARLRDELEAEFGPDAVAEAIARGKDLDPFDVAREVLAELENN
jgi:predicted ATPase/DNA-binding SARP family transcriptional activator